MKINIKATDLNLTPAIRDYIENKIGSLERFLKKIEIKREIEVFFEIARTAKRHRRGDILYAEATIPLEKKILRAEHSDWNIEVAIDKIKDKLQQEIKKYKDKKTSVRRQNRSIKNK